MSAKQTAMSASLVVLLAASPVSADADPDAAPRPAGEVHPEPAPEAIAPSDPRRDPDAPATGAPGASVPTTDPDAIAAPPPVSPARPPTGSFEIGAGFNSDDGFLARARVAQTDLFRTGTQLSLDASISERHQRFLMRFEDPTLLGTAFGLRADLYQELRQFRGFTREATGGALQLSRPLGRNLQAFVGYRLEQVEVEPQAWVLPRGSTAGPELRDGRLSALRAGLAYSTLDQPWLPLRGTSFGLTVERADRALGSELEFTRLDTWLSHHRPLGPLTLHLGGTLGLVSRDAPTSERLHFDGSSDVRGYHPGDLGPIDPLTGAALGGTLKYTARGELEVPLIPRLGLSAAGFLDVGGLHAPEGGSSGASAGVGLIWRSPLGPIRVDYAVPLDGGRPRLVFGLGGSF